jgi:putative salt-induced outer membrane protein YdiY
LRIADPRFLFIAALAAGCLVSPAAGAQAVPAPAWDLKLGFSYLATSGNTKVSSSSFDAAFHRAWRAWSVEGSAAGVSSTKRHRRTAENYNAQARAKRRLLQRLQITLGLRWERNRFAGIDGRQTADVSALWEIRDTPGWKLRALAGLSLGREEPRGDRPPADSFGGLLQVSSDARLSATASWDGQVTLLPDFTDLEDYRLEGHLGVQAALNRHLGLRLGYDLKFDHEPVAGFGATDTATTAALVLQLGAKPRD